MQKLRLDLDSLTVDSFATTPESLSARGTVFGQDTNDGVCTWATMCAQATCDGGNTCADGCGSGLGCGSATGACCTQDPNADSCGGYTQCCASTDLCASVETQDCGACPTMADRGDSCTDPGCTYCNAAC